MITLIKLELKKNKIHTYLITSLIIFIIMLGFLYLFAYAPNLEPNDKDMEILSGYNNLIPLFSVLNMAVFCVLSSVMYSKFIIEDYSGKRLFLTFSYPVNRKKIMLSKFSVVSIFTITSMIISNLIIFLIFGVTEGFIHLVKEDFTFSIMLQAIEVTFLMSVIAASAGIISVGIGLVKKSVPTTIVSAVIIASIICNIVANITSNLIMIGMVAILILLISIVFLVVMVKKVEIMEVE